MRKVFKEFGIDYRSVDLDAVEYMNDDRGGKIRAALRDHTGCNTFPQIFIKGEFIGGCTELFDACKDGTLMSQLSSHKIPFDDKVSTDPYSFLPGWLHPR